MGHHHHAHSHGDDISDHHHHSHMFHFHGHAGDEQRVAWAALLTISLLGVEIIGAIISGSLALLADAAHMVTDVAALGLAWVGMRFARRPADSRRTFGFHRMQVMIAFVNGLALFAVVGWLIKEMIERVSAPPDVMGLPVTIIGLAGLAANIASFAMLHGADGDNLNIKGAKLHILSDILGSVAATIAGVVIWTTGWMLIDPILSGLVAVILANGAWRLVKEAGHILLEGVPAHINVDTIRKDLQDHIDGVEDVHHLHAWALTHDRALMTLHICLSEETDPVTAVQAVKSRLKQRYGVAHTTVEVERDICADKHIEKTACG